MEKKELIKIAIRIGKFMLNCGAETYRAEETVTRVCATYGMNIEVFCIPTGIFVSYEDDENLTITMLKRVHRTSINLQAIADGNQFSREFAKGEMDYQTACNELRRIENQRYFSPIVIALGGCVGGGFFTLMFQANLIEFIYSFILSGITATYLIMFNQNFYTKHFIGGLISASLAIIATNFTNDAELTKVIIGPIMTLVPGVPLTVGIRDLISGELIAGSTKIAEAIFIAVAIAFGVGIALQVYFIIL